jgi:hypothetical protein
VRAYGDKHKADRERLAALLQQCIAALVPHAPCPPVAHAPLRQPYTDCSKVPALAAAADACVAALAPPAASGAHHPPPPSRGVSAGGGGSSAPPAGLFVSSLKGPVPECYRSGELWGEFMRLAELLWQPVAFLPSTEPALVSPSRPAHPNATVLAIAALAMQVADVNDRLWLRCVKVCAILSGEGGGGRPPLTRVHCAA